MPLVPVGFAQNTRDEVRLINGDGAIAGAIAGALASETGSKQQTYIAFSAKDSGADATEEQAPTLMAQQDSYAGHAIGVTCPIQEAVGVSLRGREGGATAEIAEGAMPARRASQGGGDKPHVLIPHMAVRRLTPRECERLQGFPDDYTLITINSKGGVSADGPRYKALGNSMAVPVMNWIGQRIQMVEDMDK